MTFVNVGLREVVHHALEVEVLQIHDDKHMGELVKVKNLLL